MVLQGYSPFYLGIAIGLRKPTLSLSLDGYCFVICVCVCVSTKIDGVQITYRIDFVYFLFSYHVCGRYTHAVCNIYRDPVK